jgi:hypothetical protein
VVLFPPDELDAGQWYTKPDDTWLAVSDWRTRGRLADQYSTRFTDARLTILVAEEYLADKPALTRSPQLAISGVAPTPAGLPALARAAYSHGGLERVPS